MHAKADLDTSRHATATATATSTVVAQVSRGVQQMELLRSRLDIKYRVLLYGAFALLACVMTLGELDASRRPLELSISGGSDLTLLHRKDQYTARAYLTTATSTSFNAHSTLATISVIKSVFQSISQPPMAKVCFFVNP